MNNLSTKYKLLSLFLFLIVVTGIIFESLGFSTIGRILMLVSAGTLAAMLLLSHARIGFLNARFNKTFKKLVEIDENIREIMSFSASSHRELLSYSERHEATVSRVERNLEKQARATREEVRSSSKALGTDQNLYQDKLKVDLSQLDAMLLNISGDRAHLRDIEACVRKLNNAYQSDSKEARQTNADIMDAIETLNNRGVQNHEILNLLERRIVNKLRVSPELTNVRIRVERMERRLIGLLERHRSESGDFIQEASGLLHSEFEQLNETMNEALNSYKSSQTDRWSEAAEEIKNLSVIVEKNNRVVEIDQLKYALDDQSKTFDKDYQYLKESIESYTSQLNSSIEARATEINTSIERIGTLNSNVELSQESMAKISANYAQDSLNSRQKLRKHITDTVRDSTRQVEALMKLAPRMAEVNPLIAPTGGYALDAQALLHLIDVLERMKPKVIVEFGGGTSTIWMAYICRKFDTKIISFDHLEKYLTQTQLEVERHGLGDIVSLRLAPLESLEIEGNGYTWYSLAAISDLDEVDLLFIDGPPESTCANARRPALYAMSEKLTADAVVILDDTHRESEQATIANWTEAFPMYQVVDRNISRLTVLQSQQTKKDD